MSTTFALFKTIPKLDENLEPIDYEDIGIISCAFRGNGGAVRWLDDFHIIAKWLPDNTPVYATDNSPQGIFTIGDLKREMNDN